MKELITNYQNQNISKSEFLDKISLYHKILYEYPKLVEESIIESIKITKDGLIFTIKDLDIEFKIFTKNFDQRHACLEILNFHDYEKFEKNMIRTIAKKSKVIFDIGANIGFYSILMSKISPESLIYAFEPIKDVFNDCLNNIAINGLTNIFAHEICISNLSGEITMFCDKEFTQKTSICNITNSNQAKEIKVKTTTLDSFCDQQNIKSVDFIKCDVEGAEKLVMDGGLKVIENSKPIILFELLRKWSAKFGYCPNDVLFKLQEIGYECYEMRETLIKIAEINDNTEATNFLFINTKNNFLL
jgi:FkbM family methyltransferase